MISYKLLAVISVAVSVQFIVVSGRRQLFLRLRDEIPNVEYASINAADPSSPSDPTYNFDIRYFEQQVDHFNFYGNDTFMQRYLISTQHWDKNGGPIFFYTGNEGDIIWFANNTGFMWDIAPQFHAMVVFAEHRYYGDSLPYGNQSYKKPHLTSFLTSEQALADFALLIPYLKSSIPGAANSRVVAFGGSYGGMLAAWFRMKYPDVVVGSLAASAPIWLFNGLTKCEAFYTTITNAFNKASTQCVANIRNVWNTIDNYGATEAGRTILTDVFHLCKPLNSTERADKFKDWIESTMVNIAMVNYPYPANFLENLPGWPVKAACQGLSVGFLEMKPLMMALFQFVDLYYNYTGGLKCFDIGDQATSDLGDLGWGYQACTEMVMPMCTTGVKDMFQPDPWNFTTYSDDCYKTWKVRPRLNWVGVQYWGKSIQGASNIIFSNGLLDPWSAGGVLSVPAGSLVAIIIPDGAHHLDLRPSNPLDPPSVIAARKKEKEVIQKWLTEK